MWESQNHQRRWRWFSDRQPMRHSVIRRSLYIALFFVVGHAFYYLLLVAANARLDPAAFGRFYLGWATLNVLVAPGSVLTLSLSGHFADVFRLNGARGIFPALGRVAAKLMPWALVLLVILEVVLFLAGMVIGADSVLLIAVIPLTALSSVMVDSVRAVFQGVLRFVWFGASWLVWCFGQFIFGAASLVLIGAPWAVFLGMLAANCLTLACLLTVVWRMGAAAEDKESSPAPKIDVAVQSLQAMLPLCAALGAFVILSNVDVLVAYLKLTASELGIYAASAILPKAIVTATQPAVQVLLPVATNIRGDRDGIREALFKAVGITFTLAALGAVFLWLLSGEACGGKFGINFCDPQLLSLLASAAIGVSVVRTAIIADVLGGHYWRPQLTIVVSALFAVVNWLGRTNATGLAASYSILCWLLLIALVLIKLIEWRRTGRWPLLAIRRR